MKNPFSYQGKRVVITGAYSGVGAAAVELLSSLGAAEIIALDIKEPQGPITRFIETNMGDPAAIDAAAVSIDGPVDALFNNAGIAATNPALEVMKVNYLGVRHLNEALLPKIPDGGAIAITASIAGGQWPQRLAEIQELLAIPDRGHAITWIEEHPELVGDHGQWRAHQQRLPRAHRHSAASRLQEEHDGGADQLADRADPRQAGHRRGHCDGGGLPGVRCLALRERCESERRRRIQRGTDHRSARFQHAEALSLRTVFADGG